MLRFVSFNSPCCMYRSVRAIIVFNLSHSASPIVDIP